MFLQRELAPRQRGPKSSASIQEHSETTKVEVETSDPSKRSETIDKPSTTKLDDIAELKRKVIQSRRAKQASAGVSHFDDFSLGHGLGPVPSSPQSTISSQRIGMSSLMEIPTPSVRYVFQNGSLQLWTGAAEQAGLVVFIPVGISTPLQHHQ
jgi:hypothetical protein